MALLLFKVFQVRYNKSMKLTKLALYSWFAPIILLVVGATADSLFGLVMGSIAVPVCAALLSLSIAIDAGMLRSGKDDKTTDKRVVSFAIISLFAIIFSTTRMVFGFPNFLPFSVYLVTACVTLPLALFLLAKRSP